MTPFIFVKTKLRLHCKLCKILLYIQQNTKKYYKKSTEQNRIMGHVFTTFDLETQQLHIYFKNVMGQCQANSDILIFHPTAPTDRLPLHLEFIKL
jgi:hypothetical protein